MNKYDLKPGDIVTLVRRSSRNGGGPGPCTARVEVLAPGGAVSCRETIFHPLQRESFFLWGNEGIDWLRGQHAPDSPEVLGLLAAQALRSLT